MWQNKDAIRSLDELDSFFRSLTNSSFATPFALASPEEDFCETYSMKVLADVLKSWNFQFLSGEVVDVLAQLENPVNPGLKAKMDFIDQGEASTNFGEFFV